MSKVAILAALVTGLSACGSSSPTTTRTAITFGIGGGNIAPYRVTIEPTGVIRASGRPPRQHALSSDLVASLSRRVRADFSAGVKSRHCAGTNPDIASSFIRAGGRTVTVHGACEPRFQQLWDTLAHAVGIEASRP